MAVTLDLSTDYDIVDNLESVTLTQVGREPALDVVQAVASCHRAPVSLREASTSGGVYTRQDQIWRLPGALVQGRVKPGDKITPDAAANDADGVWTVLETSWDQMNKEWRCPSRNLALVNDLRDRITIERHSGAQDAAGTFIPDWFAVYGGVPARIQEISGQQADSLGKRWSATSYTVVLDRRLVVDTRDRVVDERDGAIYEILSWSNPDRIDELMTLTCERTG